MSRGGETGGASITDALREYEVQGFTGQFRARQGGLLECLSCEESLPAEKVHRAALRRVEGASDPDDMVSINALICPRCGAKGTAVFKYGPLASPEEGDVMQRLNAVHMPSAIPGASGLLDPAEARTPRMASQTHETGFPRTPHLERGASEEET